MINLIQKHKKKTAVCIILLAVLTLCLFSRTLTYLALDIYDAYITPYNGECAYRVLHNDCSCSQYFRNIVDKEGVIPAIAAMPEQFHRCNMALQELKLRSENETTVPACCLVSACCAEIMMTPVPVSGSSSSKSTLPVPVSDSSSSKSTLQ